MARSLVLQLLLIFFPAFAELRFNSLSLFLFSFLPRVSYSIHC